MTLEELRQQFRADLEDLVVRLINRYYFNYGEPYNDEGHVFIDPGVPYADELEVLAAIPVERRTNYLTVNIAGVEFWFINGSLVNKQTYLSNADNSISLSKLINITGPTFLGKQTGTGSPEVVSVANALGMLGLTDVVSTLGNKVDKIVGSSLILDTLKALIHAPHSDDQDLTAIIASIEYLNSLIASLSPPYKIILPSADTVAGRLVGLTAGVNYPTGWVLSADDKDLIVTHGLDSEVKDIVVWSKNTLEAIKRKELGNAAYSGIYYPLGATIDSVVIESLATVNSEITIYISFS